VRSLIAHYPNARSVAMETLRPADFGGRAIGHLNFFRSIHKDTLWPHALKQLEAFGG
jgi:predicted alpha/beta hydrolase